MAKDKATAEAKSKELNEANEVLSDPEKRKKHGQLGIDGGVPEGGARYSADAQGDGGGTGQGNDGKRFAKTHPGATKRTMDRAQGGVTVAVALHERGTIAVVLNTLHLLAWRESIGVPPRIHP